MSPHLYAVRQAWESFKKEAALSGLEDPVEALAHRAIEKWASEEAGGRLSPGASMREAFAASIAGAAAVDSAVMKLAEEGAIGLDDRDFLLALNAEAALRDIGQLTKTSGALMDTLHRAITSNPGKGAIVGAAAGAGLGAWKDDDNRLRGAAFGAIPGAVLGGIAGHAWNGHLAQQDAAHAAQQSAQKKVQDEATARAAGVEAAAAAQAASQAKAEAARAAAEESADRWVENLRRGTNMHIDELGHHMNSQPANTPGRAQAEEKLNNAIALHGYIQSNKDAIKAHATAFPGKTYEEFLHSMDFPQREHWERVKKHAQNLQSQR